MTRPRSKKRVAIKSSGQVSRVLRADVTVSGTFKQEPFCELTKELAVMEGAFGWVKGLSDGRVQAVFEGTPDVIESMVQWCQKGPDGTVVDNVEVQHSRPVLHSTFNILGESDGVN